MSADNIPTLDFSGRLTGSSVLPVDMNALMRSRALIQADSGGGKSYLLRSMLEQTADLMIQTVFDVEGEFSSLREPHPDGTRLPYLIVSATEGEGDVPADPAMAAQLCRAVSEARASVILDLYDLDEAEKRLFVRNYLTELLGLPRSLREPRLIALDEAERLAPQSGSSEATAALSALSTQGRKRLLLPVFAIHRLSDFDNAVAGGLRNRFFGMQSLDTDALRAGNSLGFDKKRRQTLMELEPLTFYCHGPAFPTRQVVLARAGEILTPHGEDADKLAEGNASPPPPESLGDLLARLAEMAPEAPAFEEPEDLQRRIDGLRDELARLRRVGPDPKRVEAEVERRTKERLHLEVERAAAPLRDRISSLEVSLARVREGLLGTAQELASVLPGDAAADPAHEPRRAGPDERADPVPGRPADPDTTDEGQEPDHPEAASRSGDAPVPDDTVAYHVQGGPVPEDLPPAELDILNELEKLRTLGVKSVDRRNLAVLAGRSPKSSSYDAHVSRLRARRLLSYPSPGRLSITGAGRTVARLALGWLYDRPPHDSKKPADLHAAWLAYLPEARARILRALIDSHPEQVRREELAALVDQSPKSSSFDDHVRTLKALGVAEYPAPGAVRASALLFPGGSS